MTEPRTYPTGVTSWVDVEHRDLEGAQAFYGDLFGWSFTEATPAGAPYRYLVAALDGRDIAGLGGPADPAAPDGDVPVSSGWSTYVAVDDADAAADRVTAAGGMEVQSPVDAGEGGRSVTCADPSASAALYAEVFGWTFDDLGFATMVGVPPGFADCIGWLNPAGPGEEPHWQVSFTVEDRDTTASIAERLGGSVLRRTDSDWTRDALIRDPQGAVFTASPFDPGS